MFIFFSLGVCHRLTICCDLVDERVPVHSPEALFQEWDVFVFQIDFPYLLRDIGFEILFVLLCIMDSQVFGVPFEIVHRYVVVGKNQVVLVDFAVDDLRHLVDDGLPVVVGVHQLVYVV